MIDHKFLDELGWGVQNKWLSGRDGSLDRGQSLELIRLAKLGLEYEQKKEEFKESFDNLMKHTSGLMDSLGQNRFASIKESKPKKIEKIYEHTKEGTFFHDILLKINEIIDRVNSE